MGQSVSRGFSGAQIFSTYGAVKEAGEPLVNGIPTYYSYWTMLEGTGSYPGENYYVSCFNTDVQTNIGVYTGSWVDYEFVTEVASTYQPAFNGTSIRSLKFYAYNGILYGISISSNSGSVCPQQYYYEIIRERDVPAITSVSWTDYNAKVNVQIANPTTSTVSGSITIYCSDSTTGPWEAAGTVSVTGSTTASFIDTHGIAPGDLLPSPRYYRTMYDSTYYGYNIPIQRTVALSDAREGYTIEFYVKRNNTWTQLTETQINSGYLLRSGDIAYVKNGVVILDLANNPYYYIGELGPELWDMAIEIADDYSYGITLSAERPQ